MYAMQAHVKIGANVYTFSCNITPAQHTSINNKQNKINEILHIMNNNIATDH